MGDLENTSFSDVKAKIEDDSANIATEAGLIWAVDGDDGRLSRRPSFLDQHDVVARHSHTQQPRETAPFGPTPRLRDVVSAEAVRRENGGSARMRERQRGTSS